MFNEAIKNDYNQFVVLEIPLVINSNAITLELYFEQTSEKRYLVRECIKFGNTEVSSTLEIAHIRAYLKKFIFNKLNPSFVSEYFEPRIRTVSAKDDNKQAIERTLLVKNVKPQLHINEIDVEALLELLQISTQGFSRVKLFANYTKANISSMQTELFSTNEDGSKDVERLTYNPKLRKSKDMIRQVTAEGFNPEHIKSIIREVD
jgi:hypothetical protein